jgi:hypothetical protein
MSTLNTTTSSNPPANPNTGDMYLETDTNKIVLWDGSVWRKYNSDAPNTNAGSGNEVGSTYSEGTMTVSMGSEWNASMSSDISYFPYFVLPNYSGMTGSTVTHSGSDYNSNNFGWNDGMGGGQTESFGGRIYALTNKTGSEADLGQYLTAFDAGHSTSFHSYLSDLETYVSNLSITFMSMGVQDPANYTGFGTLNMYDQYTMANHYGFTALTWNHGATEVDLRLFIFDTGSYTWGDQKLYTFNVGTVPSYSSANPVAAQPSTMITRNMGSYGDNTMTFSSGPPTFALTPAVFTT